MLGEQVPCVVRVEHDHLRALKVGRLYVGVGRHVVAKGSDCNAVNRGRISRRRYVLHWVIGMFGIVGWLIFEVGRLHVVVR